MTSSSVSSVNSSVSNFDAAQVGSMSNDQITSLLVSGNLQPQFVTLLMNQMADNNLNSILFGSQDTSGSGAGFDELGASGLVPSNVPTSSSMNGSDVFAASSTGLTGITPQMELSVYSQLIGKTVTAVNPLDQKKITDKVTSVQMQNGQVVLNLNGVLVATANVVSIQK